MLNRQPTMKKIIRSSRPKALMYWTLVFAFFLVQAAQAQRGKHHKTSDAPFLSPSEAVAKMDIPEDFEVSILVAEPDIGEPIAFTFDSRGRLWVVENYNYVSRRSHKEEILSRKLTKLTHTPATTRFQAKLHE